MLQKILVSIVLGITAFAQVADAAVIYSQASATGTTSINSQEAVGGSDYDVFAFATFTPTQSGTIDNISWQGTSNSLPAYAGFSDGFSIDVLEGPIVLPGTTAYAPISHTFLATTSLANPTLAANGMYDYNTNVKPFYVKAGTTYRISIRSSGIAPWGWATAPGTGTISYIAGIFKFLSSPGIPVYALNNVNNSVVAPPLVNPTTVTIVPVPTPSATTVVGAIGDVQGMITSVGNGYFMTDTTINGLYGALVTYDGDTVIKYHGGLVTFAVGEIINYSYTVDVDGVILAKTVDVYPTEAVNGVGRVSGYTTTNGVYNGNGLALTTGEVLQGTAVPYINFSSASSYNQIISYSGFRNPTTGFIYVTSAKLSKLPVNFKPVLPAATVEQMFSQDVTDFSLFGQPVNLGAITASGLPAGLTINGRLITGIPTTAGTYTVTLAAYGDTIMLAGALLGTGTTTIVVNPADVTAPVVVTTPVTFVSTLADGQVGSTYTGTNLLATGVAPFTVTATGVPYGMTVSTAGILSGTPSAAGTYTINLSATSTEGVVGTGSVTITVTPAPVIPIGTTLANGKVGVSYPATSLASPSVSLYMVSNGSVSGVPAGMSVSAAGILSGTPTTAGTYQISFYAIGSGLKLLGNATSTIVVDPATVVVPPPAPVDTTAPVISMNGGDVTLIVGDVYADIGATCTDDTDATCTVNVASTVDTATAGTYTVTYTATDAAGNSSTATRTVTVNPAPVIVTPCSGTNEVITNAANVRAAIVEIGGGPSNGGLAVQLFQNSTTIVSPLTTSTFFNVGNLISFDGVMVGGVCVTTSATVSAPADTVAPVITMNGGDVTLTAGNTYTDAGATCSDNVDATCAVVTTSTVNTNVVGTYAVTYTATDAAGNVATPVVRTVTVNPAPVVIPADTTAPVIMVNGGNVSLITGATYVDAGTTCTDNIDATCTVVTTGTVNTAIAGKYTVVYSATDAVGNTSTATRTVTVTAPVVVPPTTSTGVVSTGKKAEGKGKITAITPTTITVGTTLLRITPTTVIKLQSSRPLAIGASVEYKGTKNTDASITASSVKAQ